MLKEFGREFRQDPAMRRSIYVGVGLLVGAVAVALYVSLKNSDRTPPPSSGLEFRLDLDGDGTKETALKPGLDYLMRVDKNGKITVEEYRPPQRP